MNTTTSQPKKYRTVYGYVRWSSDQQEEGNTEERQTKLIADHAKRLGVTPSQVFIDRGVSALKGDNLKKEWKRLLGKLQKGDCILVEDVDRITRKGSRTFYNTLGQVVEDKGAYIVLTSDKNCGFEVNQTNYESDWNLRMSNIVSVDEGTKRMERIQRGYDIVKQKLYVDGIWTMCGRLSWWLKNNPEKRCFEVIDARASIVKQIYNRFLKGHSLRSIVEYLNKEGVTPPRKNKTFGWSISSVRNFLRNRSVLGEFPKSTNNKKMFPQIISDDVFAQVQTKLNQRKRFSGGGSYNKNANLFKGLLFCQDCQRPLFRVSDHGVNYYKCSGIDGKGCDYHSVRVDKFEESFRMLLTQSDLLATFVKEGITPSPFKLDTLKFQLEDANKKVKKLSDIITNDPEPSESLIQSLKQIEVEKRKLQREVDEEEYRIKSMLPTLATIKEFNESKLLEKWNDSDARLQIREIIREIVSKIVVDRKSQTYTVHFSEEFTSPISVVLNDDGYEIEGLKFPYETIVYRYYCPFKGKQKPNKVNSK